MIYTRTYTDSFVNWAGSLHVLALGGSWLTADWIAKNNLYNLLSKPSIVTLIWYLVSWILMIFGWVWD